MASTIALDMVSRRLAWGAGAAGVSMIVIVVSSGEHVGSGRRRVRPGAVLGVADRVLDTLARRLLDPGHGGVVEVPGLTQGLLVARDRVVVRDVGELWAVSLSVALEVAPQPQGVYLDQRRSFPRPGSGNGALGGAVDALDVIVLHPFARDAVRRGTVGVRADRRRHRTRHRDGPVVVLDHTDHRQHPSRRQAQRR